MPDPLYAAIASAIRQPLDGAAFERCAVDLLRDARYSGLRGTPHNNDTGIDGLSGPDDDPEFGLVATTAKDYRRNLRESVRRHLDAGGAARAFVLATTQEVSSEIRLRLMRDAREQWGVRLLAIHDRGEFKQLLYRSPEWRKSLLGVIGSAQALSRFPASPRPSGAPTTGPGVPIPLIGRDAKGAELAQLRAAGGDIVLAGKPGVGKTFLLEHLAGEDWGLFDLGWSVSELKDAVLGMRPRRVVLDDAHLSPDRIAAVLQMRQETEADFSVVAVSWPGRADEVAARLPDAKRIDVEELERDRIVEVIEAVGVADRDWQRLIADQADGRAGLAATLARALRGGRVGAVATGEVLLDDLAGWYERTLETKIRRALGVLALAGDAGATVEQVGDALRRDLEETSDLMRALASGGTLGEAGGRRMNVQPADLRYPLVRDVFYGIAPLDPVGVVAAFDDPSASALPLIGAAHRGASVDREWLRSLIDWRNEQAAVEYALLGSGELREALEQAPEAWAKAASDMWGLDAREAAEWDADRRTAIAGAAYRLGVDPEYALRVLMETAAMIESADVIIAGNAPLDVVRQHLARLDHIEARLGERRTAAEVASRWLQDGKDAYVGVRVLTYAVQLELSDASADPGLGRTLTLSRATVPPSWIEPLSDIWDAIRAAAGLRPDVPVGPLVEALEPWARPEILPRRSRPGERRAMPEEAATTMRATAARAIGRLAGIFRERPGALHRLRVLARRQEIAVRIDLPDDFAALYPVRDPINSVAEGEESERRWIEAVGRVADTLAERPIHEAAERLVFLAREADEAGIGWPPGARRLAQALAERTEEPEALLDALIGAGADVSLIEAPLDRVAELKRPGWEAALERLLGDGEAAPAAIRVALARPVGERLKWLASEACAARPGLIKLWLPRSHVDHETIAVLLDGPDRVALETALTYGSLVHLRPEEPPASLRARWREVVVNVPVDERNTEEVRTLNEILERDSGLCVDWLRARLRQADNDIPRDTGAAVGALSPEDRAALIADIPTEAAAGVARTMRYAVERLVSGDLDPARALLERSDLEGAHAAALTGDPDEGWMERALLAVDRGWSPERIASTTLLYRPRDSHSAYWKAMVRRCEELIPASDSRDAARRKRIAEALVAISEEQRDDARRREREERVHGRR